MITILVATECRTIGALGVFTWKIRQGTGSDEAAAITDAGNKWRESGYETRGARKYIEPKRPRR